MNATRQISGRWRAALIAAGAAASVAGAAHAQLASNGGPIKYSADNMEYVDNDKRLVLSGNVDLLQNDARLQASKLTLYFARAAAEDPNAKDTMGSGDIEKIVAEGDVHYNRPKQRARGDQAVYLAATDTVTFSGNVVISSDQTVIRGDTLVLDVGTGRTTLKAGAATGGRVQGVLRPRQNSGR
jgi:lipopolysaccharide export system protein LptA